jgi:hypothetical protein
LGRPYELEQASISKNERNPAVKCDFFANVKVIAVPHRAKQEAGFGKKERWSPLVATASS